MSDFSLQIPSLDLPQEDSQQSEEIPRLTDDNGSLASPFLAAIPEQDRRIVEKYIKDWDAGVTKKFQGIHEEYKPYKELGNFDRVQKAMEVIAILEEDPELFYQNLAQLLELNEDEMTDELNDLGQQDQQNEVDPRDSEIADLRAAVESMQNNYQQSQTAATEKQQMDELDNYIKTMHNEHGDFDEDWVLLQISRGTDPVEAINSWNTMIGSKVGSFAKKSSPNILSGSGSSPGNQVDPSKFDSKQRKEYIAAMMTAANQS